MLRRRRRPDDPVPAFHRAWDAWWNNDGPAGVARILADTWGGPTRSGYRTEADDIGDLSLYGASPPSDFENHLRDLAEDAGVDHPTDTAQKAASEICAWMEAHAPKLVTEPSQPRWHIHPAFGAHRLDGEQFARDRTDKEIGDEWARLTDDEQDGLEVPFFTAALRLLIGEPVEVEIYESGADRLRGAGLVEENAAGRRRDSPQRSGTRARRSRTFGFEVDTVVVLSGMLTAEVAVLLPTMGPLFVTVGEEAKPRLYMHGSWAGVTLVASESEIDRLTAGRRGTGRPSD